MIFISRKHFDKVVKRHVQDAINEEKCRLDSIVEHVAKSRMQQEMYYHKEKVKAEVIDLAKDSDFIKALAKEINEYQVKK